MTHSTKTAATPTLNQQGIDLQQFGVYLGELHVILYGLGPHQDLTAEEMGNLVAKIRPATIRIEEEFAAILEAARGKA